MAEKPKKGGRTAKPQETVESPARAESTLQIGSVEQGFPIVGVGASAGGLEALEELFSDMPTDTGMAFVVVTHQHPGHTRTQPALWCTKRAHGKETLLRGPFSAIYCRCARRRDHAQATRRKVARDI